MQRNRSAPARPTKITLYEIKTELAKVSVNRIPNYSKHIGCGLPARALQYSSIIQDIVQWRFTISQTNWPSVSISRNNNTGAPQSTPDRHDFCITTSSHLLCASKPSLCRPIRYLTESIFSTNSQGCKPESRSQSCLTQIVF